MSVKIMVAVLESELPPVAKVVMMKYANHAHQDGSNSFPSIKTVAATARVSKRTVSRILKTSRELRILIPEKVGFGGRKRNPRGQSYKVNVERINDLRDEEFKKTYAAIIAAEKETSANKVANILAEKRLPNSDKHMPLEWQRTNASQVAEKTSLNVKESDAHVRQTSSSRPVEKSSPSSEPMDSQESPIWTENQERLKNLPIWPVLQRCIPEWDDGNRLLLAVEAPGLGFTVLKWSAQEFEQILNRKVMCVVRAWVGPELVKRGVERNLTTAHRRDGDVITLNDPAWCVWRRGCQAIDRNGPYGLAILACLPDDLDESGLVLVPPSTKEAHAILDYREILERIFDTPVRKMFAFWIDAAREAQEAIDKQHEQSNDYAQKIDVA